MLFCRQLKKNTYKPLMAQTISMNSVIHNPVALGVKRLSRVLDWSSVTDLKEGRLLVRSQLKSWLQLLECETKVPVQPQQANLVHFECMYKCVIFTVILLCLIHFCSESWHGAGSDMSFQAMSSASMKRITGRMSYQVHFRVLHHLWHPALSVMIQHMT